MIKLVSVLKKKADLDIEEFQNYWLRSNSNLAVALPNLKGYSQSHTLKSAYKKIKPVSDGIAEFQFENSDRYRECLRSNEFDSFQRDLESFTQPEQNIYLVVQERLIKNNNVIPDGVKSIELVKRKEGMKIPDFQSYWTKTHGPLGASIPQVNRYVQNHVTLDSYELEQSPKLDGLAITWFDNTQAMRESATTSEYEFTRADEENFLTIPLEFIITKEHVFF